MRQGLFIKDDRWPGDRRWPIMDWILKGWLDSLKMDLTFERGDSQAPRGHALVYFRVDTEPDRVYATYVVTLPIKADLTKYVPPFLASHLGSLPLNDLSAFAMPPVPEPVDSYAQLDLLSQQRGDDMVYAGNIFSFDLPRMMELVTEAVQSYTQLCAPGMTAVVSAEGGPPEQVPADPQPPQAANDDPSYGVNDVLFSFMSESDKLGELARLLGRLRFAVEGADRETANEVEEEIGVLARHLPEEFRVANLLAVAKDTSERSSQLAKLYLDRCFRLSAGDNGEARRLEDQIRELHSDG